ncbi:MAG: BtrH N-terminal domain-containing protein [Actinomycetota bacterium]|nr:BtrH N-terminal domain-containing protein [Actinomycetota bacterium]
MFIEKFPHRPGGHCGSTAMRDILKFYGHDYTEDMVFGIGVGIGFTYFKHPEMVPPVYIGGRIYNLEQLLSRNLGFELELVEGIDNKQAWADVKNLLDKGIPTMVHADVYYLDYLRAKRHFSTHRIVLVGYDEDRGVSFVADNDRDTIQECSLENLEKARSSAWLPQPANNAYYIIRVPQELEPLERAIPRCA